MLKKIRDFRKKTQDQYMNDHRDSLEPWKKKVMELHERSGFLFYYENCELEKADGSRLVIQGDIAVSDQAIQKQLKPVPAVSGSGRGDGTIRIGLYLYDGQARLLGEGIMLSDPYEKEEKRRGFLRSRKHEFIMEISSLSGEAFQDLDERRRKKLLGNLYRSLSLISDYSF